jgi:SAM-dependent methyltransferase
MLEQQTAPLPPPTIQDIKRAIQRRVPLQHAPLPVESLFRHETELAYRQDFLQLAVPPAGPSFLARLKTGVKRLLRLCLRWVLIRQVEFNGVLVDHLRDMARLFTVVDRSMAELVNKVIVQQNQIDGLGKQQEQLCGEIDQLRRKNQRLNDTLTAYRLRWQRLQQPVANGDGPNGETAVRPSLIDYFLFENEFRGPREEVACRQRIYVPYFQDQGPVLDIACGRGEFVELLVEEGIEVQGIDADADMADFCRELGLPVLRADAMHYLGELPEQSLAGIFLGRGVERLQPEALVQLLGQCWARLRKGGVLVIEAVNPLCPGAGATFFRDPAHVRPVHPELLRFLLESQRFAVEETLFSAPADDALEPVASMAAGSTLAGAGRVTEEKALTRYHDYALVGRK